MSIRWPKAFSYSNEQVAVFLGISERTLLYWKKEKINPRTNKVYNFNDFQEFQEFINHVKGSN